MSDEWSQQCDAEEWRRICSLEPWELDAELIAAGYTAEQLDTFSTEIRQVTQEALAAAYERLDKELIETHCERKEMEPER